MLKHGRGEIARHQLLPAADVHGALDGVFQFADVAGPRVPVEQAPRFGIDGLHALAERRRKLVQKMVRQKFHVAAPSNSNSAEAFVRVRDSSRAAVLHALDLGARGIIIPDVQSVEEARRLVEYAKYYPLGARGFAFSRSAKYGFLPELKQIGDYFTATNQRTILMPQCETAGALEHIEEIAALDGIDGIFVGPYDLSVALGAPARFATPRFAEALDRVIAACRASGKLAFIYANTRAYFAQGYQGAPIARIRPFWSRPFRACCRRNGTLQKNAKVRPPRSGNTSIKSGVIRIRRTPRFFTCC